MRFEKLLAKSSDTPDDPHPNATHVGHTSQVVNAARQLLSLRGLASLLAAGLPPEWLPRLERIVLTAAFVHDLGKCSDHFQAMVRHLRQAPQLIRHEALSLWLCWEGQPLHEWLLPAVLGSKIDLDLALCAAAGHHRKFPSGAFANPDDMPGPSITLLTSHPDFVQLLAAGAKLLKLEPPPAVADVTITRRSSPESQFSAWQAAGEDSIDLDSPEARLLAVAKALVLDADVAGSAEPRAGARTKWIDAQLSHRATRERLEGIVKRRLNGHRLRPFQREVAASTHPVTLVRAGCGTGKTVAAYQWCAEQHPGKQLWVTYPTTGTATEGFRDYVREADIDALLDHSRSDIDLDILSAADDESQKEPQREVDRLEALRTWGAEVVTCTVDTVLCIVQNSRKGLYAWAGLSDSAIVFDEIHAYDDRLFGELLRFLDSLPGIPALLMTASLPAGRHKALEDCVLRAHRQPLAVVAGPADLEKHPRYSRALSANPWEHVRACLAANGKVLWVSNTVDRCLELADEAPAGSNPLVYHSRFRYEDRVKRHGAVIDAFNGPGAAFAITTQVAEMSLDLSADLLVTDLAPIPSLIQRLGRLNRRSTPDDPQPCREFIVIEFNGMPYSHDDLEGARTWLTRLPPISLSQRDLINAWEQSEAAPLPLIASTWLDGRFVSEVADCRESSPTVSILLDDDAKAVRKGEKRALEVLLPMNPPPAAIAKQLRKSGFWSVAPTNIITYHAMTGGQWVK